MSGPGEISTPETRRAEARKLAAESLVSDLLAFVEDTAASSMDGELKARARVLAARVDIEAARVLAKMKDETFCTTHRVSVSVCGCGEHDGVW